MISVLFWRLRKINSNKKIITKCKVLVKLSFATTTTFVFYRKANRHWERESVIWSWFTAGGTGFQTWVSVIPVQPSTYLQPFSEVKQNFSSELNSDNLKITYQVHLGVWGELKQVRIPQRKAKGIRAWSTDSYQQRPSQVFSPQLGDGEEIGSCALPLQTELHAKGHCLTSSFLNVCKIHLESSLNYWILNTSPEFLSQNLLRRGIYFFFP